MYDLPRLVNPKLAKTLSTSNITVITVFTNKNFANVNTAKFLDHFKRHKTDEKQQDLFVTHFFNKNNHRW